MKPDERRTAIIAAAVAEVTERGFARTTSRDVGRRAEVTHGLLHHYFPDHQTLLAQAFASIRYPILPEVALVDVDSKGARRAVREILFIRHHSLYAPRDFDVSPFFQVVKPRLAQGFDYRQLEWQAPAQPTPEADAGG